MDLLLDVYEPVRFDDTVMPAIVVIHGGGFNGGSKRTGWISEWAQALYPACGDAKASIHWINATVDDYPVSPDHIAVIGGSASSVLAVGLGVSDPDDCTEEISGDDDPTLSTTNLDQPSGVATVIDHWRGTSILVVLELMDGVDRFDATDAPVSIVHSTEAPTVPFAEAETIQAAYNETGVAYEWHPLEGRGHGAWGATLDGQTLFESAYDFIIETQALQVDEPGTPPA